MMDIYHIKFELLRPGPAHNQLLSPLTSYIALCGSEGPVTVHFPFEHRQLLNRLERLRYLTPSGAILPQQREAEVREIGEMIGELLGKVPSLVSEIGNARAGGKSLVHLRFSLSAYELSLVPFEFAIAPNGFPASGSPLFLQSSLPICLTREVRRDRPLPVSWDRTPRILFAFANPGSLPAVPAQEHLEALRRAVEPWVKWKATPQERFKEVKALITVVPDATLEMISQACGECEFTHIHILAHGAPFEHAGDRHYGLVFCSENDASGPDIVDGERLVLTLTGHASTETASCRPTLVSLATCDSGNTGSVLTPGGSIAHELHAGGIPWVIASQFPLWMRASSMATEVLYKGLLRGDDPRWVLHDMRQRLRTGSANTHDWASIVAYASVPWDFERQVEAFHNRQVRSEIEIMFDRAEKIVDTPPEGTAASGRSADFAELQSLYRSIRGSLAGWIKELPSSAPLRERAERLGMSGASEKRMGILFKREGEEDRAKKAYALACDCYKQALKADPHNHWVITQYLSLSAILAGNGERGALAREYGDWWTAARQIALWELRNASEESEAWTHGTLAELEMLGVIYREGKVNREEVKRRVIEHCRAIRDLAVKDPFPVRSTCRQFQRYCQWWKRDEWQDVAEAAVKTLEEGGSWVGRVYLRSGQTDVPDGG
jgi:hypothetical protein